VIRRGSHKLIESLEDGRLDLSDLAADPGEQHNLATAEGPLAARLHEELQAWRLRVQAAWSTTPNPRYRAE
jgi:hypothetical protein